MLRFALFSTPDEGPPFFKDHICVTHRVVSQEGDYCTLIKRVLHLEIRGREKYAEQCMGWESTIEDT